MNEQSFSFEGRYSAKEAADEDLKKRRMEDLHRELREARANFDEAVIALANFPLATKFLHQKKYREAQDDLRKASKQIRTCMNSLEKLFVEGGVIEIEHEQPNEQWNVRNPDDSKEERQESWEMNIPRKAEK